MGIADDSTQSTRDLHTVFTLQPQIEQYEVNGVALQHGGEFRSARDRRHAQIIAGQVIEHELPDSRIVVDGEHMGGP